MSNLAYADTLKFERHNGKIIAMSPAYLRHNGVAFNIAVIFSKYLKGKTCRAFPDGAAVHFSEKDMLVPDAMIVCNKDIIKPNGIHGAPDLVVEVLSATTSKRDRGYKKSAYEKYGVKEYWIIDTNSCQIEVYLLKEDRYELDNTYSIFTNDMLEIMTDEEKAEIQMEFKTSLFDDLIISVEEVFEDIIE